MAIRNSRGLDPPTLLLSPHHGDSQSQSRTRRKGGGGWEDYSVSGSTTQGPAGGTRALRWAGEVEWVPRNKSTITNLTEEY